MSGPQMFGVGGECRFDLLTKMKLDNCRVFPGVSVAGDENKISKYRFAVELLGFSSTGLGQNSDLYDAGEVLMVVLDPIVEAQIWSKEKFSIYVGAGATVNYVFDASFLNAGFKVRPFAMSFPMPRGTALDVEFNLRFYPKEFTPANFGESGAPPGNEIEVVKGFSAVFRF